MTKELTYRTFDELLSNVLSDLRTLDQEGMIEPQDLIKVAQRINQELTPRIYKDKETILELSKGRVRLPNDYYMMNLALLCGSVTVTEPVIQGIQTEDIILPADCNNPSPIPGSFYNTTCRPACNNVVRMTECGKEYVVVQHIAHSTHTYKQFLKLRVDTHKTLGQNCPNQSWHHVDRHAYIKDGWLYCNFTEGKIYLSYKGAMEDDDGNLLVLDHPMINEYYEYALKTRVYENLLLQGEQYSEIYKLMRQNMRDARLEARNVVFTPDFKELQDVWVANRIVQYNKYYRMFQSCSIV